MSPAMSTVQVLFTRLGHCIVETLVAGLSCIYSSWSSHRLTVQMLFVLCHGSCSSSWVCQDEFTLMSLRVYSSMV